VKEKRGPKARGWLARRFGGRGGGAHDIHSAWGEVATRTGGQLVEKGHTPEIHIQHGPWTVIVDKYVVHTGNIVLTYTRTRADLLAHDDFSFQLHPRTIFSRFGWIFRLADVSVGDQEVEERYAVRSRQSTRIRSLMQDRSLRNLLLAQPNMTLALAGLSWWRRRKRGSRVRVVSVRTDGVITEVDRLVGFIQLVQATLDQLARIGTAERAPVLEGRHNGDLRRRP
jgi:hypothetical protein